MSPWLFIKSRSTVVVLSGVTGVALLTWLVGAQQAPLTYSSGDGIPYAVILPLAGAAFIAMGARAPFGDLERAVARPVRLLECCLVAASLCLAAALTFLATQGLPPPVSAPAGVRNLIGLTGASLLAATFSGGRTAWVLPSAYVVAVMSLGTGPTDGYWAWLLRPDDDGGAWFIALLAAGAGLVALAIRGVPEPPHES